MGQDRCTETLSGGIACLWQALAAWAFGTGKSNCLKVGGGDEFSTDSGLR